MKSVRQHSRIAIYGDHRWAYALFMSEGEVSTREWGEGAGEGLFKSVRG